MGILEDVNWKTAAGVEGEDKFREMHDRDDTVSILSATSPSWGAIEDGANCKGYLIWTLSTAGHGSTAIKPLYGLMNLT